jgi:pyridoxamine 5'-phosphate oxidase family protein
MFTENEIAYMKSQRPARIGTVSGNSQPDVSPVGYEFDGNYFYFGGMNNEATRKYENVAKGDTQVALAIDDLESVNPWKPRGIKIYGMAEIVERDGYAGMAAVPTYVLDPRHRGVGTSRDRQWLMANSHPTKRFTSRSHKSERESQ